MAGSQHVTITARYEPRVSYETSLRSIAPELRDSELDLVEDHVDDRMPFRTWAGSVDGRTFDRFARPWALPREEQDGGTSMFDDCDDQVRVEPDARLAAGVWKDGLMHSGRAAPTRPSSIAYHTRSDRVLSRSFCWICAQCVSTVRTDK
jgi:hypothetical protein